MDDETTFEIRDDVISEEIEDELVILDLEGDVYFSLNEVGRVIWEEMESGESLSGIVDAICASYEVERERAEADAREFLDDALGRELISEE